MCDPLSASLASIALGVNAWSTYNQSKATKRNMKAMQNAKENAYREGIKKQDAFAAEAGSEFNPMLADQGAEAFNIAQQAGANNRMQAFDAARENVGDYSVADQDNAPKNVQMFKEQVFGKAADESKRNSDALATLSGYGDAQLGQNLSRNAFGRSFGNLADKAGGEARLLPMEMSSAVRNVYKGPNSSLSLINNASQLAMMAAASGVGGNVTNGSTGGKGGSTGGKAFGGYNQS